MPLPALLGGALLGKVTGFVADQVSSGAKQLVAKISPSKARKEEMQQISAAAKGHQEPMATTTQLSPQSNLQWGVGIEVGSGRPPSVEPGLNIGGVNVYIIVAVVAVLIAMYFAMKD